MTAPEQVRIFDTTLRDGEQAPGCTMTLPEKLQVATQLARLRVAVIEAGFPASSPGEQESVCAIAEQVGAMDGPTICGLARAAAGDIEACAAAVRPAFHRRIHTFLATSDIHLQHKLRMMRGRSCRMSSSLRRMHHDPISAFCERCSKRPPRRAPPH
jgi:2-isopropylmalate synthase